MRCDDTTNAGKLGRKTAKMNWIFVGRFVSYCAGVWIIGGALGVCAAMHALACHFCSSGSGASAITVVQRLNAGGCYAATILREAGCPFVWLLPISHRSGRSLHKEVCYAADSWFFAERKLFWLLKPTITSRRMVGNSKTGAQRCG